MASVLTIRKLPEEVQDALRLRAAHAGRSVEAEAREILAAACLPASSISNWAEGLSLRAQARTQGQAQTDSADLIREGRDAR
ncbi:MAG: plasmid stabilization protein [Azospirillaceae bacterium]|nr:plasmid stabilization protein [Azospirillaceae bacterium]